MAGYHMTLDPDRLYQLCLKKTKDGGPSFLFELSKCLDLTHRLEQT